MACVWCALSSVLVETVNVCYFMVFTLLFSVDLFVFLRCCFTLVWIKVALVVAVRCKSEPLWLWWWLIGILRWDGVNEI